MTPQIQIFANLHKEILKPLGFRKISHRSERSIEKLHQAIACCSSFWNSENHYRFTLEVRVSHEDFFNLYQPGKPFPGLSERFMPLISWRPKNPVNGGVLWWEMSPTTPIEKIQKEVFDTASTQCLPIIELTSSVAGLVKFCETEPLDFPYIPLSWGLKKLGLIKEAQQVIDEAVDSGKFKIDSVQYWQSKLLANPTVKRDAP